MLTALMPLKSYEPEFLRRAIGSMFAQTNGEWRLLVVVEKRDLARLRGVLERELQDSRIVMITNEGRKLAGAFNTGMRHASTEFVATLLADDAWSADAVAVLAREIGEHRSVDFFHSARVIIDEADAAISPIYPSRESFEIEEFVQTSPVKHLLCWRREFALAHGGMDETLNSVGPDDYDFPWCMAERGAVFKAVKECLYRYRDHRECYRLTTHLPLSVHKAELRRILEKHGANAAQVEARLAASERGYLRQCLYRSRVDMAIKRLSGHEARRGWRETYT